MDFRVLTEINSDECVYIAGPEVFYYTGVKKWAHMRLQAEAQGFMVAMPNDTQILTNVEDDPHGFADEIFANCARSINRTTALIVDLEDFRGPVPDGGSIFELGMAYARGARCYAFSRDCRPAAEKDYHSKFVDGRIFDASDLEHPHPFLPFSANVLGAAKLIEGTFSDSLKQFQSDLNWSRIHGEKLRLNEEARGIELNPKGRPKKVYISTAQRFASNNVAIFAELESICSQRGLELITALPDRESADPMERAGNDFRANIRALSEADLVILDLNDYLGLEPNPDVAFEAGYAYQSGKYVRGFMSDTRDMLDRVPHHGVELDQRDVVGRDVEFYEYPLNLMFASSMPILQGEMKEAVAAVLNEFVE
ncbi:nucleoside 2-deoxyribosyltransferase [Actinomyces urinae]|uniref:nucleoside 2-deoxyribosyltransferase n=1 Tax=Actinomyces urinae TaxID=1689268 RepID=UPI00092FE737|nr:nucleoside 2-deoxyribosyltransferase [Actinomyces urinae]